MSLLTEVETVVGDVRYIYDFFELSFLVQRRVEQLDERLYDHGEVFSLVVSTTVDLWRETEKNTLLIVTEVVVRRCITCIFRLAILVIFIASAGKSKRTRTATYQNLFGSLIISDQLCDLIHLVPFLVKTGAEEPV